MADWRTQALTPYVRQLTESTPHGLAVEFGPNVPDTDIIHPHTAGTFPAESIRLPAYHTLQVQPTSGAEIGTTGEILAYDLPLTMRPYFDIRFYDWDQDTLDKILAWMVARTELRIWAWGLWIAVGKIANVPIARPATAELVVTFALSGLRLLEAGSGDYDCLVNDYDGAGIGYIQIPMLNIPFAIEPADITIFGANSNLFGTEILP